MHSTHTTPDVPEQDEGSKYKALIKIISGLSALDKLAKDDLKRKNPNVPDHALPRPKYRDMTSNELTRSIIKWLHLNGHQAERVSVTGRVIDRRETITDGIGRRKQIGSLTWIKTSGQVGSADISSIIGGKPVKIEVKIGKDRQSQHQKEYQREVEESGGVYLIVKNFQGFYDWYLGIGKEVSDG